ncbi:TRAP transporter large permease [Ahrensia kielensis]|uniref:TRAP transporter large permease n=1 Tax=Ahrensia kielensis TaxID=76980 RepID=UPI0003682A51|nr:TRAP transporter large permease [Ahrensia kielensis]
MDPFTVGLIIIAGLITLLVLGVPIAFALLLMGGAGVLLTSGIAGATFILSGLPYSSIGELSLITIPLFLFMGHMAFAAGITGRAFDTAKAWFGHVSGGLPIATVFACAGFAAVSGSSIATAATMAKITVPEMLKSGYSAKMAGATVATAGTLGVLIPPSSILVIYSIATQAPIADLFLAAIIPGVFSAFAYAGTIWLMVRMSPKTRSATALPKAPLRRRFTTLLSSWEIVLLFALVMVPLYFGIATATETAAFGAGAALLITMFRGSERLKSLKDGLLNSGSATATIMLLIAGSALFSTALATSQIPQLVASWAGSLDLGPTQMTILLLIPFLILGCFIDGISTIFLTMPIVFPIVLQSDINPVLFGILVTKTIEIGAVTPPIGVNAFVVAGTVKGISVKDVFIGSIPFILADLALIAVLIAAPSIALGVLK